MPRLLIEEADWTKMKSWISEAAPNEVGWFGVVEPLPEGRGLVRHMKLLEQEVSSGEVDWDDVAFAKYLEWLYLPVADGGAGWTLNEYGVFSGHSHGSMNVFWSGTDKDFIHKMGHSVPWMFSGVFNTKGESKYRLDIFKGLNNSVCPLLDEEGHPVVFEDQKAVTLEVLPHMGLLDLYVKAEEVEGPYNERIEALKKELAEQEKAREDATKEVKEELKEASKTLNDGIKVAAKEEFKEKVTRWKYSGGQKGKGQTKQITSTTGGASTNGSKQPKKSSSVSNGGGRRGGQRVGKDAATDYDSTRDGQWFRCWDDSTGMASIFKLRSVLEDEDLIPIQDIDLETLAKLTPEERRSLSNRRKISNEELELIVAAYPYSAVHDY